ncbi:MAG: DUF6448 family protein [Desulfobacterales bacterium]|nr:DUF6448 family protein [Desulfobacterales bacterium]
MEKGDVALVLKWVKAENEEETRTVFKKALSARVQGKEDSEIADWCFVETLVRAHRARAVWEVDACKKTQGRNCGYRTGICHGLC